MDSINEEIKNLNIEKILSFIFIVVSLINIFGDNVLIDSINSNDECLKNKANELFLWGLIISFILYIYIIVRNYNFYRQKKDAGLDASSEYKRFIGSVIILIGFILIFDYFLESGFRTNNPPVL